MPLTDIIFSTASDPLTGQGAPANGAASGGGSTAKPVLAQIAAAGRGVASITITSGGGSVTPSTPFSLTAVLIDAGVFGMLFEPPFNIFGSINPASFSGFLIEGLYVDTTGAGTDGLTFILMGVAAQTLFTTLTVNGVPFTSASATFTPGASTTWFWPLSHPFASAGVFAGNFA